MPSEQLRVHSVPEVLTDVTVRAFSQVESFTLRSPFMAVAATLPSGEVEARADMDSILLLWFILEHNALFSYLRDDDVGVDDDDDMDDADVDTDDDSNVEKEAFCL